MSDYIPLELIRIVLARLPVDDVLRCTSVCKLWYSLVTSPTFASLHQSLSSPNQEPRLLIKYYTNENSRARYCLHCDDQTFDEIEELDPPCDGRIVIIDILNGLVCLISYKENAIWLWNPSLRKYINLPKPRMKPGALGIDCSIGFGFIATTNEYKIVLYQYSTKTGRRRAEVYQLSTGSWRNVIVGDGYNFSHPYTSRQTHLKGILHWKSFYPEKNNPAYSKCIYSFDLEKEEFGKVMIPSCLRHDSHLNFVLCTLRESLCLIDRTRYPSSDIWMMKEYGVADSWEKLFIINMEQHDLIGFLKFRYNGELLCEKLPKSTSIHVRRLVSYDCNNNRVNNLGFRAICSDSSVYTYVDNLVLSTAPNDSKLVRLMKNQPKSEEFTKKLKSVLS